ncbi:Hypothetical predicted protein [Podarcis lilfordi]|uniref:Uncharacterized protein n=1 Tax=Podarcis lilfordi TaxID=74358 RepID=A0AA35LFF4_9SAUR|nr:Hypothetical predicted protein [Podarcis lilfordi]
MIILVIQCKNKEKLIRYGLLKKVTTDIHTHTKKKKRGGGNLRFLPSAALRRDMAKNFLLGSDACLLCLRLNHRLHFQRAPKTDQCSPESGNHWQNILVSQLSWFILFCFCFPYRAKEFSVIGPGDFKRTIPSLGKESRTNGFQVTISALSHLLF